VAQITHYDVGDIWTPQVTFTVSGTPTDPTSITARSKDPAGVVTVLGPVPGATGGGGISRVSVGVFRIAVDLDSTGHWFARFEGTGAAAATEEHEAIVDPSEFYDNAGLSDRALVGLAETKDWLAEYQIDTSRDQKIVQAINGASERIMQVAGREFKPNGTNPETRIFDLGCNGYKVQIGDLQTATTASSTISVSELDTGALLHSFVATDYLAMPRNRKPWQPITSLFFQRIVRGYYRVGNYLSVNGYWGFPVVPEDVRHATMDTVAYWLDRDVEHFRQDLGAGTGEAGQTVFVGSSTPTVYPLPPEAYQIAVGYRRKLVA
jgi:hypothetical protein